jgi:hypothetical protein
MRKQFLHSTLGTVILIRLAEHESKGHDEKLIANVVFNVQDPAPPIFEVARHCEGSYDMRRVITRLNKVVNDRGPPIDQRPLRGGAMEKYSDHVQLPLSEAFGGVSAVLKVTDRG